MSPPEDMVHLPQRVDRPDRAFDGWFFFHPDAVPERWRTRAVNVALVPLLPGEAGGLLRDGSVKPELDATDEALAHHVAAGTTVAEAARALRMSLRGAQRRLAGLRRRFGVDSTGELRTLLARRGF